MVDIKTKETVKDIKVLDKSQAALSHVNNVFIRSKEQVKQTQSSEYENPDDYAVSKTSAGAKITAIAAGRELKNAPNKAVNNFGKAKAHFREVKALSRAERQKTAIEAHKKARQSKQKADFFKNRAEKAKQVVKEAKKNVQEAKNAVREVKRTGKSVKQSVKSVKGTGRGAIKTAEKSVKTADRTAKTALKTAKQTAKTAQKMAQAAAKSAKAAAQTAKASAKAAQTAAKIAAKAITAAVKAIMAAVKGLVSAIAAGGSVAVLIIVIICMVGMLVGSVFGIFFANDSGTAGYNENGVTMADVTGNLNAELTAKIEQIKTVNVYDEVIITSDNGTAGIKWNEVMAVYAVKIGENDEVVTLNQSKIDALTVVAWDMTVLEFASETIDIENADGTTANKTVLTITVTHKGCSEIAALYGFSDKQVQQLNELMSAGDVW